MAKVHFLSGETMPPKEYCIVCFTNVGMLIKKDLATLSHATVICMFVIMHVRNLLSQKSPKVKKYSLKEIVNLMGSNLRFENFGLLNLVN